MDLVTIRELKRRVTGAPEPYLLHVQVDTVLQKTARNGKPYFQLTFVDALDRVDLRAWEDAPAFPQAEKLRSGMFVALSGEWLETEKFGIDARNWEASPLEEGAIAELLRGGDALLKKQEEDYAFITQTCGEMEDPRLRSLCQAFLQRHGERLRRTGAARHYHHARRGGLVEHVAQMMRSAKAVASVYRELNEDLLLSGVLFHDSGKLWENCYAEKGFTMPYPESGELLGHIAIGMELVNMLWRELMEGGEAGAWLTLEPASNEVRMHLLHLIAAHHGEQQFGSPVVPKTPEAMALHYVDNLDAKMEMFADGYETAAALGPSVFDRVFPLPGRLVRPLEKFAGGEEPGDEGGDGEETADEETGD